MKDSDKELIINSLVRLGDKMDSLRDKMDEDFRIVHRKIDEHITTSNQKHEDGNKRVSKIDNRLTGIETKWAAVTIVIAVIGSNIHKIISFITKD